MRKSASIVACVLLSGSLLLFLSAASQAQGPSLEAKKAWRGLLAFRNQDLGQLENQRERIEKLANQIIPERADQTSFRHPRFIWNITTPKNEARVVLLDFQDGVSIPGQAVHKLYFFDKRGALVGATLVSNGWRQLPDQVRLIRRADLKLSLLELSSFGVGLTAYHGFVRQYYALLGDKAVLVRLEKSGTALIRNLYACENPAFGSPLPKRDVDEWAKALASTDVVEVLRSLMWLGGHHVDLKELEYEKSLADDWKIISCPEEAAADTKLYLAVRAREDVRQTLLRLARSSNGWLRQAAEMALTPVDSSILFDPMSSR